MGDVGDTAPDFTLQGVDSWRIRSFTLEETVEDGEFVIPSFYVYDFSPVCTTQLCELEGMDLFESDERVKMFGLARALRPQGVRRPARPLVPAAP